MKIAKWVGVAAAAVMLAAAWAPVRAQESAAQPAGGKALLGRWDLTLKAPDREYPAWIEIKEKGGKPAALFTSRWGNARPLPKVEIDGDKITFVSPKEEEDTKQDLVFTGTLAGKTLSGTIAGFEGAAWTWTGVRAPVLDKMVHFVRWGEPVTLFDGKDLAGWHESGPGKTHWTVKDGNLVSPGNGPELIGEKKFEDFKLHLEFNCGKDANSGVYLRGRYETQIETESQGEPPSHHTGGVYGFLAPTPEQPRTPDVWQTFDITLVGRHVTVVLNGKTVIDDKEIPGLTGGALDSHEGMPGPIYLQGSEKGHVMFRNITVTPGK